VVKVGKISNHLIIKDSQWIIGLSKELTSVNSKFVEPWFVTICIL